MITTRTQALLMVALHERTNLNKFKNLHIDVATGEPSSLMGDALYDAINNKKVVSYHAWHARNNLVWSDSGERVFLNDIDKNSVERRPITVFDLKRYLDEGRVKEGQIVPKYYYYSRTKSHQGEKRRSVVMSEPKPQSSDKVKDQQVEKIIPVVVTPELKPQSSDNVQVVAAPNHAERPHHSPLRGLRSICKKVWRLSLYKRSGQIARNRQRATYSVHYDPIVTRIRFKFSDASTAGGEVPANTMAPSARTPQ